MIIPYNLHLAVHEEKDCYPTIYTGNSPHPWGTRTMVSHFAGDLTGTTILWRDVLCCVKSDQYFAIPGKEERTLTLMPLEREAAFRGRFSLELP